MKGEKNPYYTRNPQHMKHTCLILWNLPQKKGHEPDNIRSTLDYQQDLRISPNQASLSSKASRDLWLTPWEPETIQIMETHILKKNHVDKLFLVLTLSLIAPEEYQKVNKKIHKK